MGEKGGALVRYPLSHGYCLILEIDVSEIILRFIIILRLSVALTITIQEETAELAKVFTIEFASTLNIC